MSGQMITLYPLGSLVGTGGILRTTPPVDVRGYSGGSFTLQVDGFLGTAGPPPSTLQVTIQTSNDGINWFNCATQFNAGVPINCPGLPMNTLYTVVVLDLASVVRLQISGNDIGGGFIGFTISVHACLKSS